MVPRKVNILDRDRLIAHLVSLQDEDRRLRFGGMVTDDYIKDYVTSSFKTNCKWFACEEECKIVAACHASVLDGQAELGCSVDKEYRGNKIAQAMFDRAVTWLRAQGITEVYMHCLTENGAMKHIARKNDMTVVSEHGEVDATVSVQPATPFTPIVDAYADRMAIYDMLYKRNLVGWKKIVESLRT